MIFVAEIGSNHKGIKALAHEMIRKSAEAGADIIKFQLGHKKHPTSYADPVVGNLHLRYIDDWAPELKEWCEYYGAEFMASIFSEDGLKVAKSIGMKRYKIAHQMANNWELCKKIAHEAHETFVSSIRFAQKWIETPTIYRPLFVTTEYPMYPSNLKMPLDFDGYYGYSSHVPGIADSLLAIARGAVLVEKHVTLDKTEESIKDNHFALSFEEFKLMVDVGTSLARLVEHV